MLYNNKILCEEFVSEQWKYIDKSLPEEEFIFWDNHLKTCSLCCARLAETERTLSTYESLPLLDISDEAFERMITKATKKKRIFAWLSGFKLPVLKLSAPLSLVFNRVALSTASLAVILVLFFIFHRPEVEKPEGKRIASVDSSSGNTQPADVSEPNTNSVSEVKSNPEVSYMQVRYEWKGNKLNRKIIEVGTNLVRMEASTQEGKNVYNDKWALRAIAIAQQIERLKKDIDDSSL